MTTIMPENNKRLIRSIDELLLALSELEHVCSFKIVRGSGQRGTPSWKCSECGKVTKSS